MSSQKIIENKISAVKKYLKITERYNKYSAKEIEQDVDIRGAVERYLYLAVQATIELAEATVAYKEYRKPTSMSEAFDILHEEEIIPLKLTEKMIAMTGFRNVIIHGYETVNYSVVYDIIHNGVRDIETFIEMIIDKLKI